MCGIGALTFARQPALHSIGVTALLDVGSGLVSVFAIIPLIEGLVVETSRPAAEE